MLIEFHFYRRIYQHQSLVASVLVVIYRSMRLGQMDDGLLSNIGQIFGTSFSPFGNLIESRFEVTKLDQFHFCILHFSGQKRIDHR